MKTAIYHQADLRAVELEVIGENLDGTVNLGRDGVVVVSHCRVSDVAEYGTCTADGFRATPPATLAGRVQPQDSVPLPLQRGVLPAVKAPVNTQSHEAPPVVKKPVSP